MLLSMALRTCDLVVRFCAFCGTQIINLSYLIVIGSTLLPILFNIYVKLLRKGCRVLEWNIRTLMISTLLFSISSSQGLINILKHYLILIMVLIKDRRLKLISDKAKALLIKRNLNSGTEIKFVLVGVFSPKRAVVNFGITS